MVVLDPVAVSVVVTTKQPDQPYAMLSVVRTEKYQARASLAQSQPGRHKAGPYSWRLQQIIEWFCKNSICTGGRNCRVVDHAAVFVRKEMLCNPA